MLVSDTNSVSTGAGGGGGTEVGTLTKADSSLLLRVAHDTDDLIIPSVPLFDQISAAGTELPDGAKTAQGGSASIIRLAADASAVDGYYVGMRVMQTANNEHRLCTAYNGTTKDATVASAWATTPTGSTQYDIFMDCLNKSTLRIKPTFSAPSQSGAFMKAFLFVKFYDLSRNMVIGKTIEPMTYNEFTYALTGNYLSPTAAILENSRAIGNVIDLPIVRGAQGYKFRLSGGVYQCNTWSAPATPNTIATSGNISLYSVAV